MRVGVGLIAAVICTLAACSLQENAVEHPIIDEIPNGKDIPSSTAQPWLRRLGTRLLAAREAWEIGVSDGPPESTFGNIVDIAVSPLGRVHVVDQMYNQVLVYSQTGEFSGAFGREGSGPGEFRRPVAMDFLPDSSLVLGAAGQMVVLRNDSIPPTLEYAITQGDGVPPIHDLCVMATRLVVRPQPSPFERSVYVITPTGDASVSFGEGYSHGDQVTRTELSVGNIACIRALNLVIAGFQYLPAIRAFRPDGHELWAAQVTDFDPLSFFEIRSAGRGVRFRTNRGEPGDFVLGIVSLPPVAALMQVAHLAGAESTSTGRSIQRILSIDSYLIDPSTGESIALGESLPRIMAATDNAFYAVKEDSVQGFLRLAAYRYANHEADHE